MIHLQKSMIVAQNIHTLHSRRPSKASGHSPNPSMLYLYTYGKDKAEQIDDHLQFERENFKELVRD